MAAVAASQPYLAQPIDAGQRKVYVVDEYGFVDVPITEVLEEGRLQIYPEVESKGYFTVRLRGSSLQLQAGGYVGLIALNDLVVIDVRPRVPVSNLSRMLHISGYAPQALRFMTRSYETTPGAIDSLLDVYSEAIVSATELIQARGLLRSYDQVREVTEFPRGRILVHEDITRLKPRNIRHKASVAWYQRVTDNAANRCLKYAVWFLAARYGRMRSKSATARRLQRRLNTSYRLFDGVLLDLRRDFLKDAIVTGRAPLPGLRAYYRDALDLALAIVLQQAVVLDHEGHDLRLSSLILNMNDVFEAYLRAVLRAQAEQERWPGRVLDGNTVGGKRLFDRAPSVPANPDIVFAVTTPRTHRIPLLIDAKYKPAPAAPDRDDLNQVITYGASYRAPKVALAYPRGRSPMNPRLSLLGTIGPLAVYRYIFDLGADDLAAEERLFAKTMRKMAFGEDAAGDTELTLLSA